MKPGLQVLMADRKLGAASKLAFLLLWDMAGEQPGEIVITADLLAGRCGRSPRAVHLWLDQLAKHELVHIIERNERRGTIRLAVYNPCPGDREATPDPQARLPFATAEPVGQDVPPVPPSTEVSAPKPPRSLVPKKQELVSCQSTKESKGPKDSKDSKSEPDDAGPMAAAMAALAATMLETRDPAEQKVRLKARIQSACRGDVADWVAGAAADLVVRYGVPIQELDAILADVDALRTAGSLRSAGRFFHAKARDLAKRFGAPWPRKQRAEVAPQKPPAAGYPCHT